MKGIIELGLKLPRFTFWPVRKGQAGGGPSRALCNKIKKPNN